jgi:hypothetical protein
MGLECPAYGSLHREALPAYPSSNLPKCVLPAPAYGASCIAITPLAVSASYWNELHLAFVFCHRKAIIPLYPRQQATMPSTKMPFSLSTSPILHTTTQHRVQLYSLHAASWLSSAIAASLVARQPADLAECACIHANSVLYPLPPEASYFTLHAFDSLRVGSSIPQSVGLVVGFIHAPLQLQANAHRDRASADPSPPGPSWAALHL